MPTNQFYEGMMAGVTLYAWWKDGTQYVGTCGRTLKQAVMEIHRMRDGDPEAMKEIAEDNQQMLNHLTREDDG